MSSCGRLGEAAKEGAPPWRLAPVVANRGVANAPVQQQPQPGDGRDSFLTRAAGDVPGFGGLDRILVRRGEREEAELRSLHARGYEPGGGASEGQRGEARRVTALVNCRTVFYDEARHERVVASACRPLR